MDAFDEMIADIKRLEEVAAANGFADSVWSIENTDFAAKHPYPKAKSMRYVTDYLGVQSGVEEIPIPGPTWLDLWRAADQLLKNSADKHHVYIELFKNHGEVIELWCGS
jgi:hypothetical protein